MNARILAGLIALLFVLSGCFSSSSGGGGDLDDRERAAAAASASVLSGALDDPDDDDDGGGGKSGGSAKAQLMAALAQAEHCEDGGTHEATGRQGVNVGSPFTQDGTMSIEEDIYDDCRSGSSSGFDMRIDGYAAWGSAETGAVDYIRWAGEQDERLDGPGQYVVEWPDVTWRFQGVGHTCEECTMGTGFQDYRQYMRWEIESVDTDFTFQFGEPTELFHTTAEWVGDTTASQTVDGYMSLDLAGTQCNFEIEYETLTALQTENFGTVDETIASGELRLSIPGGDSFNVEYINGDVYIDGELFDPDWDNPCEGAFDISVSTR